jgi:hypothetical protein
MALHGRLAVLQVGAELANLVEQAGTLLLQLITIQALPARTFLSHGSSLPLFMPTALACPAL